MSPAPSDPEPTPEESTDRRRRADDEADDARQRVRRQDIAEASLARAEAIVALRRVAEQQNANIAALTSTVEALATAVSARPTRRETFGLVGRLLTVVTLVTLLVVGLMFNAILQQGDDRSRTLSGLAANQDDLDTLVQFVERVDASQGPSPELTAAMAAVSDIRHLLCLDHPGDPACVPRP